MPIRCGRNNSRPCPSIWPVPYLDSRLRRRDEVRMRLPRGDPLEKSRSGEPDAEYSVSPPKRFPAQCRAEYLDAHFGTGDRLWDTSPMAASLFVIRPCGKQLIYLHVCVRVRSYMSPLCRVFIVQAGILAVIKRRRAVGLDWSTMIGDVLPMPGTRGFQHKAVAVRVSMHARYNPPVAGPSFSQVIAVEPQRPFDMWLRHSSNNGVSHKPHLTRLILCTLSSTQSTLFILFLRLLATLCHRSARELALLPF